MALELLTTTAFEKDMRRIRKQGKDLDKLEWKLLSTFSRSRSACLRAAARIRYAGIGRDIGIAMWNPTGYCFTS